MNLLAVFVAGALGAACRYLVDGLVQEHFGGVFPLGTFVVNVSGCFFLGIVIGAIVSSSGSPALLKLALGTGFIGGYTTFSTLMYESLALLREGARRLASLNLGLSLVAGLSAAALGLWIGGLLAG